MASKFSTWKDSVRLVCEEVACVSIHDLNANWYDLFDEGLSAREAAFIALIMDGYFTELDIEERYPGWDTDEAPLALEDEPPF